MTARADTADYKALFLSGAPMMDVRAPIEFNKGSFPNTINAPLMTDIERQLVGTKYKQLGQEAAIALGHELVSGSIQGERVGTWKEFIVQNPEGYLFCFRGGLRSRTTQAWLKEVGVDYPLVTGGYKAMRRFLIDQTEEILGARDAIIVGGRTGSGKTILIKDIDCALDLEGLANHKGSSFGRSFDDYQPPQISFENALAVDLIQIDSEMNNDPIFLEDEGNRIGRLSMPMPIIEKMLNSPQVLVDEVISSRIQNIKIDYVSDLLKIHENEPEGGGFTAFSTFLLSGLVRIRKRLGGATCSEITSLMQQALDHHRDTGEDHLHEAWIEALLTKYYDPMYDYQLSRKDQPILFKGSRADILEWQKATYPN